MTERNLIEKKFKDELKNHVSMKFLFRQWVTTFQETPPMGYKRMNVIDNTIPVNGVKDYRVNILKTGEIRFSTIKDMFCVEMNYPFAKDKWASGFTDLCFSKEVLFESPPV